MKTKVLFGALLLIVNQLVAQPTITGKSPVKKIRSGTTVITRTKSLPDLILMEEKFTDANNNSIIDGNESCFIHFQVKNIGKGEALNVYVKVTQKNTFISGLEFPPVLKLGTIAPETVMDVNIPIKGRMDLANGMAEFKIEVNEERGLDAFPLEMRIEAQKFQPPRVVVADAAFSTEDGGMIKLGYPIILKLIVQNIGKGTANDVIADFSFPNPNCLLVSDTNRYGFGSLKSGQTRSVDFLFTANRKYSNNQIPIRVHLTEKMGKYARDTVLSVNLNQTLTSRSQVTIQGIKTEESKIQLASLSSDVDKNIPVSRKTYPNRYALVIGNEDYTKYQRGLGSEVNVSFARNDATVFKDYLINAFGLDPRNVFLLTDATTGDMLQKIDLVSKLVSKTGSEAELFFYYAGHGLPDETTKTPYLIPVDVNASNLTAAIKLSDVYSKFSQTDAKRVTIFLDACFSGGSREAGLLAARAVKIRPKEDMLTGNMVVITASSGEQSALPYKDKQHGMFTYFLLKKIQDALGDVTYGELAEYVKKNVSLESLKINQKEQDPTVNVSLMVSDNWKDWRIR